MTYSLPNGNTVRMMVIDGYMRLVEFTPEGEKRVFDPRSKEYQNEVAEGVEVKPAYHMP